VARDDKRGRVTPKKGAQAPRPRRPITPARIGPFSRPDKNAPLGQVGRRPSSPRTLAVYAAVYLVCGVASFFLLHRSLGIIVGVVLIGLALLWFRGAATAQMRQNKRVDEQE
jgi:Flp pilus assembly protein TadB